MKIIPLDIVGRSSQGGNAYTNAVELLQNEKGDWILSVRATPGHWYLKTWIDAEYPIRLAIDFGSGWILENAAEIIRAAMVIAYPTAPSLS